MKKITLSIFIEVFVFALAGCGGKDKNTLVVGARMCRIIH
ncbi:hypothetical protein KOY_01547 [Bacillus cereus VDM021]|nr:hypothetical protein IIW_03735 [Bacillus cereus VD136]EOP77290.1 hypothetical protein KOW_02985 [Bacillus cereus VDM006]EOQ19248.1 hypothetical protein KOY_01547 [Bacillus cereus VDM021]OOG92939.1 hypothetical protein BTH41_04437 [Bacillus mycoides]